MNLATLFILSLAFFFVTSSVNAADGDPVLDWAGNPVLAGRPYDLWAVGLNRGPVGIGSSVDGSACNRTVIDKRNADPPNTPDAVSFYPYDTSETLVRVGKDYNVLFYRDAQQPCNTWQVNLEIGSEWHNFVTTGGQSGFLGCEKVNAWFQFQEADADAHLYYIVFNPRICDPTSNCVEYITFQPTNGEDVLYLNQRGFLPNTTYEPLRVNFSPNNTFILPKWA